MANAKKKADELIIEYVSDNELKEWENGENV